MTTMINIALIITIFPLFVREKENVFNIYIYIYVCVFIHKNTSYGL